MRRNRIALLFLILCSCFLVETRGGNISYLLFYFTLLIPVLSIVYIYFVYNSFAIKQETSTDLLAKEESAFYQYTIKNEGRLANTKICLHIDKDLCSIDEMNDSTQCSLLPKEAITKRSVLCCHYRGSYDIGIDKVMIRDYLNLFTCTFTCNTTVRIHVLPRVLHLSTLVIAPNIEDNKNYTPRTNGKQQLPDSEVRPYQSYDLPRRIHWKASAKQGQLLTRKYIEEPKADLLLVMDLKQLVLSAKQRLIVEDKIIESTLSIVDYYVRNRVPISILFDLHGVQTITIRDRNQFDSFYKLCSNLTFESTMSVNNLLQYASVYFPSQTYTILLTATTPDEVYESAYSYTSNLNDLSIIYIGDSKETNKQVMVNERVHLYQIGSNHKIQDILERNN